MRGSQLAPLQLAPGGFAFVKPTCDRGILLAAHAALVQQLAQLKANVRALRCLEGAVCREKFFRYFFTCIKLANSFTGP